MSIDLRLPILFGLCMALCGWVLPVVAQVPPPVDEAALRAEIEKRLEGLSAKLEQFAESIRVKQSERSEAIVATLQSLKGVYAPSRFGSLKRISEMPEVAEYAGRLAILKETRHLTLLLDKGLLEQQKRLRVQLEQGIERQKRVRDEIVTLTTTLAAKPEVTPEQKALLASLGQQQNEIAAGLASVADRLANILIEIRCVDAQSEQLTGRMERSFKLLWILSGDAGEVATVLEALPAKDVKTDERQGICEDIDIQQLAMTAAMQKVHKDMVTMEGFQDVVLVVRDLELQQEEAFEQQRQPSKDGVKHELDRPK